MREKTRFQSTRSTKLKTKDTKEKQRRSLQIPSRPGTNLMVSNVELMSCGRLRPMTSVAGFICALGVLVLMAGCAQERPSARPSAPSTAPVAPSTAMAILTTMTAPPATVYEVANDFHKWSSTLWRYIDPEVKETFEGPASGVGSIYRWSGNEVGQGTMTITESKPGQQVVIKVKCIGPYSSSSTMVLDMKGEGAGSAVTWSMKGGAWLGR